MCSIFGMNFIDKSMLVGIGVEGENRGTDATGIGTLKNNEFNIEKNDIKATDFNWDDIEDNEVDFWLGHTRNTTKGDEKDNYNNHPFINSDKNVILAHNGVINNDIYLKKQKDLPDTEIETDSYVVIQLIDLVKYMHKKEVVDIKVIKEVVELLSGSFALSILTKNSLFLLRHSNPIHVCYNGEELIYASTKDMIIDGLEKNTEYENETDFGGFIGEIDSDIIYEFDLKEKTFVNKKAFESKSKFSYKNYSRSVYKNENWEKNKGGNWVWKGKGSKNKSKSNKSKSSKSKNKKQNKKSKTNTNNRSKNDNNNDSNNDDTDIIQGTLSEEEFQDLSANEKNVYKLCDHCGNYYRYNFGGYSSKFGQYLCLDCNEEKSKSNEGGDVVNYSKYKNAQKV